MRVINRIFLMILFFSTAFHLYGINYTDDNRIAVQKNVGRQYQIALDSIPPDQTGMRNITSVQMAKEMIPGWNVGNSLEALPGETSWGNPRISQVLIDAVKKAGFKSVRITVAWSKFTDANTFKIDESWLDRVEEVVNYVLSANLYAIINEHWDNGWIQPTYSQQEYVNKRLAAMWQQIAVRFRDYDDHLLFAGTNEIMVTGNYGTPTKEYYTVQNGYNQTFVNAVRSTGGCNHYRHLLVQGFNTNINNTLSFFTAPKDVVPNRLMVEVHYYDPYNFTINSNSTITQWGKNATNSQKTETWANEAWADDQFNKMKINFIDKGYAVILGEYGVIARTNLGSTQLNEEYAGYRRYYMNYVTGSMVKNGVVPIYWDNGGTGNFGFGLFNRTTGAVVYQDIIKAIMDAVTLNTDIGYINEDTQPSSYSLMQNYPNPFNPETVISYQLASNVYASLKVYDSLGREVATLIDEYKPAGTYSVKYNTRQFERSRELPSGIYFYELIAGDYRETRKMMLLK
jgi:endoglucanase